ncbi:uncharacterized protein [Branchiostoma lanceolatum]|uniref:uncharacterized protein n=1 Tax=Branchiostoma lanceolatum TaxID=7740 RepID=UPI0034554F59
MALLRVFYIWWQRRVRNMWRLALGFTVTGIAFLLVFMRSNSELQKNTSSECVLEHAQYSMEDESYPEDGWSPIDSVWSDAMSNGTFYLASRDNVSIVLWKPGMRPMKAKRPYGRTKKTVKRPVPKMSLEAQQKFFTLTNVSKRYAKRSSSTWKNWPINRHWSIERT